MTRREEFQDIIEFSWRSNTKALLKELRAKGVKIERPTGGVGQVIHQGYTDTIKIPRNYPNPIAVLHHEGGHVTTRDLSTRERKNLSPWNSLQRYRGSKRYSGVMASLKETDGDTRGYVFRDARRKLQNEQAANRAARARMEPDMLPDYDRVMEPSYKTYLNYAENRVTDQGRLESLKKIYGRHFSVRDELNEIIEFGLLGHPLKYSRPYIETDGTIPQGGGSYQSPEDFRRLHAGNPNLTANDQIAKAAAKARKGGLIVIGTKKEKGGWKKVATDDGLTHARDAKRTVIRHELSHSIQRAKDKHWTRGQFNPLKMFLGEVGAYATEHRRMKGQSLINRAFPTFTAIPKALQSTNAAHGITSKLKGYITRVIR